MIANVKLVGQVAGEREHIVAHSSIGDPVLAVPEPTNAYDRNAIAVYTAPIGTLAHDIVSSTTDEERGVGTIHPNDRRLMMDRQAGYVPAGLASRLDLPAEGLVGYITEVRYKPNEDAYNKSTNTVKVVDDVVIGFDFALRLDL